MGWSSGGTLHARKRIDYRNAFQTGLTARLRPAGSGTHVAVSTGMSGFAIVLMSLWFGVLGLALVVCLFSSAPLAAAGPVLIMAFGGVLLAVGRWFARDEVAFLTEFLIETLDLERVR